MLTQVASINGVDTPSGNLPLYFLLCHIIVLLSWQINSLSLLSKKRFCLRIMGWKISAVGLTDANITHRSVALARFAPHPLPETACRCYGGSKHGAKCAQTYTYTTGVARAMRYRLNVVLYPPSHPSAKRDWELAANAPLEYDAFIFYAQTDGAARITPHSTPGVGNEWLTAAVDR